jgi:ADP-ribosylglycohydrolase
MDSGKIENTKIFEKIHACLLAGAVGDAMGFPAETYHYKTVREKWGMVDRPIVRENSTEWTPPVVDTVYTDDTVMRHMVCKAIIDTQGHPTPYSIAKVWKETINDFNDWRWWCNTRIVGAKLKWGDWLDVRMLGNSSVACNDAAMIIAPIGILNAGDSERAALQAYDLACVWQTGYSRECAGSMAAAHAALFSPTAKAEDAVEAAKKYCPTFAPYVDRAVELAVKCGDIDAFTEQYYERYIPGPNEEYWMSLGKDWVRPGEPFSFNADPFEVCSLGIAFYVLAKGDMKKAIIGGASFGRDCDTIAGIAGSLTGALYGMSNLPKSWVDKVMHACPEPDIKEIAVQLTGLLHARLNSEQGGIKAMLNEFGK